MTSHEAGLSVPDWPLSYGKLMPPMVGNVFWEHGHRMIAGTVGILTLILACWLQWAWKPTEGVRPEMAVSGLTPFGSRGIKRLGWIALGAVILQAILGGLTVKMLLPPAVSIFHACLAQTFFCLILSITYFLSPRFLSGKKYSQVYSKPTLFWMTTGFIYLQLILGAVVRHTHQGVVFHVINAFLVLIHVLLTNNRIMNFYQSDRLISRFSAGMVFATLIQLFLGMGSFIFKFVLERSYAPSQAEVIFTAAHQTTGAVILGLSVLISLIASLR